MSPQKATEKPATTDKPAGIKYELIPDADFGEGFDAQGIERAAQLDIHPPLKLPGENEQLRVTLVSEPRKVRSDALPKGIGWFIDVQKDDMVYSLVVPNSLRHGLLVLARKGVWDTYAGHDVIITSQRGKMDSAVFQGIAKTYRVVLA